MSGSVRYAKNWLRKDKREHETSPRNHIRNVQTGWVGSSVLDTVSRTSSIGDTSSSSSKVVVVVLGFSRSEPMAVPLVVVMGWKKRQKKESDVVMLLFLCFFKFWLRF